jgi:hypothetical protein
MKLKTTDKNMPGDWGVFTETMKRIVAVPHSEIKARMEQDKARKRRIQKASSVRASRSKKG